MSIFFFLFFLSTKNRSTKQFKILFLTKILLRSEAKLAAPGQGLNVTFLFGESKLLAIAFKGPRG